jgi:hypothetical protein
MQKNNLWYKSVCYENNDDYIHKLANKFKIKGIETNSFYRGYDAIYFYKDLIHYVAQINDDSNCVILLEENNRYKVNKKPNEYHQIKISKNRLAVFYDDVWYELFKFVSKRGQK